MSLFSNLTRGIFRENPTFRLVLGMCPTLATTTSLENALGMGAATTFVLCGSNTAISLLRKLIPAQIRIPAYIIVIATFVTVVDLLMQAHLPALHAKLGIYIPLIVVNCIVFARAESFASKNPVADSLADGLGMGAGFTLALSLMAFIREVFGNGTFFGMPIPVLSDNHISILTMAPGGFFVFGLLIAAVNKFSAHKPKKQDFGCTGCPSAEICSHSCVNREEAAAND